MMATFAASVVPIVLRDVSVTTVKPLEKTAHVETIDPNYNDLIAVDMYVPVLFAYRLGSSMDHSDAETSYSELVNLMKESLRKVLVPFFPYAGLWISTVEGKRRQLICDDGGVPFIEAFADADLDDVMLETRVASLSSLQGQSALGFDPTQARQPIRPEGLPALFVQVTRFKSGGLTLSTTFHHCTVDGEGHFYFMRAWSDIATKGKTLIVPNHDRTLAKGYENILPPSSLDVTLPKWIEPWTSKSFQVNKLAVESMKEDVKEQSNNNGTYVSTLDCICAQLYKILSRLPSSITGADEIVPVTTVEGRTRFYNPPLPEYYVGNVFVTMSLPKISTSELLSSTPTFVARKIREKLLSTSHETWLSAERIAEVTEVVTNERVAPWAISSWLGFPMYEIDFGVGKPFYVLGLHSMFALEGALGFCCIAPPRPSLSHLSAATILFGSTPQLFEALHSDPQFSSFFLEI